MQALERGALGRMNGAREFFPWISIRDGAAKRLDGAGFVQVLDYVGRLRDRHEAGCAVHRMAWRRCGQRPRSADG